MPTLHNLLFDLLSWFWCWSERLWYLVPDRFSNRLFNCTWRSSDWLPNRLLDLRLVGARHFLKLLISIIFLWLNRLSNFFIYLHFARYNLFFLCLNFSRQNIVIAVVLVEQFFKFRLSWSHSLFLLFFHFRYLYLISVLLLQLSFFQ